MLFHVKVDKRHTAVIFVSVVHGRMDLQQISGRVGECFFFLAQKVIVSGEIYISSGHWANRFECQDVEARVVGEPEDFSSVTAGGCGGKWSEGVEEY